MRLLILAIVELLFFFHFKAEYVTDQCDDKNEETGKPCRGVPEGSNQVKKTETTNLVQKKTRLETASFLQEGDDDSKEREVIEDDSGDLVEDDSKATSKKATSKRLARHSIGKGYYRRRPRPPRPPPPPPRPYVPPPTAPPVVARNVKMARPSQISFQRSQCDLPTMQLPLAKQAEVSGGGNSLTSTLFSTGTASAGLGLAGGIATIGATMGTAAATGGIGLMVAGVATGVLGPLLFPESPPMTEDDVRNIAEEISSQGDQKVVNLMNAQMTHIESCFNNLQSQMAEQEEHRAAMHVYHYFREKISETKAQLHLILHAHDARKAHEDFDDLHTLCHTIHAATSEITDNVDWKVRGIQYSAPLVHDWASWCYTGYVAWNTVHAIYPGAPENEDALQILKHGKRVMEMFENYYYIASTHHKLRGNRDLGLLRMYQMYTSAFTSNMIFATDMAERNKPLPPMPPHGERTVCYCRRKFTYPSRRLLQTNATIEESEGLGDVSSATNQESEDLEDSSEMSPPWNRQVCRKTTDGSELCPRRLVCSERDSNLIGYETCSIPYYSKKDYCRVCKDGTCTNTVTWRHYNLISRRAEQQYLCFQRGGIYIPNW